MANFRTHYDNLKVARNAPDSVIKAAYKALCQTYHPDKYPGSNKEAERIMKIINASYVALIDPVERALHDALIKNKEASTTEQQSYKGQDRREAPKTEEPPPSAKSNQQSYSTSTETGQERRRKMWEEWQESEATEKQHHQKQDRHEAPKTEEPPPSTNPNPHTESSNIKFYIKPEKSDINPFAILVVIIVILIFLNFAVFGLKSHDPLLSLLLFLIVGLLAVAEWSKADRVKRTIHDSWIGEQKEQANQQTNFTETEAATDQWQHKSQKEQAPPPESKPSKSGTPTYLWRRYFARFIIDYSISGLLMCLAFVYWLETGHPVPKWMPLNNIYWLFFCAPLWVILEPIILSIFGTTPGKALFRLRLVSDNKKPNYLGRSVAVWAVGMGFGIPLVFLFTMLNAARRLKENGKTDWDRWTGFSVKAEPLSIIRKIVLIVVSTVLFVSLIMACNIIWFVVNKTETSQEQTQQVESVQSTQQALPSINNNARKGLFDDVLDPQPQQAIPPSITNAEDMFQRANNFYNQGKYAEALPLYQNLAEQGYSGAQISLGKMYESGNGVIKDFNQAAFWYRKAGEAGDVNKEIANTALNKLISIFQAQARSDEKVQARLNAQAKAKALLDEKAQAQSYLEKQTQALLEAQVQAQARLDVQTQALARAKAAADKLGVKLPNGGIIFYVDSSGSHGLAAKASDESNRLNWTDATDTDYGSGWRLPTNDELQLLYEQKTVVGGFTAGNYWSSTKSANRTAWCQNFSDGRTYYYPIDYEINVRAVRAF